ncbi:MAG: tetratricopeptide repeat protein [Cyanobacteria bacterium J06641_5]
MSAAENKKRNIWVAGVLVVVVGVFVLFAIAPVFTAFSGSDSPETANNPNNPAAGVDSSADAAAGLEALEAQAQGYEAVLEREPDNRNALQGLLEIRLQQNDLENAVVPLEALADLQPEQTRYRLVLAQVKEQLGDLPGAEESYRTLLKGDPAELLALQGLVALLVQQNRADEAVGEVQNTLEIADELNATGTEVIPVKPVRFLLAQIYTVVQRWDEAIAIYDAAVAEDSNDFRPVLGKAIALLEQGDPEGSTPLFEKAYALAPANFKPQIAQIGGLQIEGVTVPAPATPVPAAPGAGETEAAPTEPAPAE